jgi:hypothetical protein
MSEKEWPHIKNFVVKINTSYKSAVLTTWERNSEFSHLNNLQPGSLLSPQWPFDIRMPRKWWHAFLMGFFPQHRQRIFSNVVYRSDICGAHVVLYVLPEIKSGGGGGGGGSGFLGGHALGPPLQLRLPENVLSRNFRTIKPKCGINNTSSFCLSYGEISTVAIQFLKCDHSFLDILYFLQIQTTIRRRWNIICSSHDSSQQINKLKLFIFTVLFALFSPKQV